MPWTRDAVREWWMTATARYRVAGNTPTALAKVDDKLVAFGSAPCDNSLSSLVDAYCDWELLGHRNSTIEQGLSALVCDGIGRNVNFKLLRAKSLISRGYFLYFLHNFLYRPMGLGEEDLYNYSVNVSGSVGEGANYNQVQLAPTPGQSLYGLPRSLLVPMIPNSLMEKVVGTTAKHKSPEIKDFNLVNLLDFILEDEFWKPFDSSPGSIIFTPRLSGCSFLVRENYNKGIHECAHFQPARILQPQELGRKHGIATYSKPLLATVLRKAYADNEERVHRKGYKIKFIYGKTETGKEKYSYSCFASILGGVNHFGIPVIYSQEFSTAVDRIVQIFPKWDDKIAYSETNGMFLG